MVGSLLDAVHVREQEVAQRVREVVWIAMKLEIDGDSSSTYSRIHLFCDG